MCAYSAKNRKNGNIGYKFAHKGKLCEPIEKIEYTMCPKKRPPFYFLNNLVKN